MRGEAWRGFWGVAIGLFARAYLSTLRVTVEVDAGLDATDPRPWVLVFWHGEQLALLAWRRRRTTYALVSWSKDGQMQARVLPCLGMRVERGSSSRGGARGLAAIVKRLRGGHDAAFAVDGPRGPRFEVAEGALVAARAAGAHLVPMGATAERGWVLAKTWDQFRIPWPFTRVTVRLGPPMDPSEASVADIAAAIHRANGLRGRPATEVVASGKRSHLQTTGTPAS